VEEFIRFCKEIQPQSREDIQRLFEGVVCFPYDKELLLQAFLFFNLNHYFPFCSNLLLFEKSPNGENTDQGKCDFVYLTEDNKIALIETKFIDTEDTGDTERKRRNKHRNKVFEQVLDLQQKFSSRWNLDSNFINCCIFTTEDLSHRREATLVETKYVSIEELKKWQQVFREELLSQPEHSKPNEIPMNSNAGHRTPSDDSRIEKSQEEKPNTDVLTELWMKTNTCDVCPHPDVCAANKICYYDL
jgi:hypothetical protein